MEGTLNKMNLFGKPPLFFGIEEVKIENANLVILGLPWDNSSSYRKGSAKAPDYIRQATTSTLYNPFSEALINVTEQFKIFDYGNANCTREDSNPCEYQKNIVKILSEIYHKNNSCHFIFLGGDHLITYFSIKSLMDSGFYKDKNIGIIYLDAHPDLYDRYENNKYSHACVLRRIIDETNIIPKNIIQVGIRTTTPNQKSYVNENGIRSISRKEFHKTGPEESAQIVIESMNQNIDLIYLSIDMDVLDPAFAPGLGNPEPGGLTTTEVVDFIHCLSMPLHSFDVAEVCPNYDKSNVTAFAAAKLIKEGLAKIF